MQYKKSATAHSTSRGWRYGGCRVHYYLQAFASACESHVYSNYVLFKLLKE